MGGLLGPAPARLHCSPAEASDNRQPDQAMAPGGKAALIQFALLPLPLVVHLVAAAGRLCFFHSQQMMQSSEQGLSVALMPAGEHLDQMPVQHKPVRACPELWMQLACCACCAHFASVQMSFLLLPWPMSCHQLGSYAAPDRPLQGLVQAERSERLC